MKIVFIGTVDVSYAILDKLIRMDADISGVVTRRSKGMNTDHADLTPLCRAHHIPCLMADEVMEIVMVKWISEKKPDIIFCFGWSYLLKEEVLRIPPRGVLGFHPACLPRNRGRHPLIWTLALGLETAGSSFFFMDQGADSGDLISQECIPVDYEDTAATLYEKIKAAALSQVDAFFPKLRDGTAQRNIQNQEKATYWRKRSVEDGRIDFRMSKRAVYNLVRALTKPYPGAHVMYHGRLVKIWQVREVECRDLDIEPGKVLDSGPWGLDVKCYTGAVRILQHEFETIPEKGEYLL
jgi:methionyl-tRNA formyltransferase